VILDDLENDENVRSLTQRDKLHHWLRGTILQLGPPDGSMDAVYAGTVLHYDSVLNRTLKSPTWHAARHQAIIRWPDRMDLWETWEQLLLRDGEVAADAYYQDHQPEMDAGAEVSWPEMRPLLMLMALRAEDHRAFDRELQNDPGRDEHAPFKDLRYWTELPSDLVYFGVLDPSLGRRNKVRDPSAILVGGVHRPTGVLYVVEARIGRLTPDQQIALVIELQRGYHCLVWVIEAVQFQEFLRTELVKRSAAAGVPVPARAVVPHTDKGLRIESLQPHTANGLIRFHRTQTILIEQLRYWPEADHDDGPDALQMLWAAAVSGAGSLPKIRAGRRQPSDRDLLRRIHGDQPAWTY